MAYAAIANGGTLYKPYLIKEIFSNDGRVVKKYEPKVVSKTTVKPTTLDAVKKGLNMVVNEVGGTAWWHRGEGIRMAGKTGTSQVRSMSSKELFSKCKDMPYKDRHHGLFVAFAPYKNPKVAVAVIVEHGCGGSSAAAPVAKEVMQTYMKKYEPELHAKYAAEDKEFTRRYWASRKKREEAEKKKQELESEEEDQQLVEEVKELSTEAE